MTRATRVTRAICKQLTDLLLPGRLDPCKRPLKQLRIELHVPLVIRAIRVASAADVRVRIGQLELEFYIFLHLELLGLLGLPGLPL